jgi:2'-5' RNA ligase
MKQTVRTFVAIEISEPVRRAAAKLIETLGTAAADVKWVDPQNLHLTVKFLGDVSLKETARICQAVQKAAAEVEPFELALGGVGAFPKIERPRTIWIGGHCEAGGTDTMSLLHEKIEQRLAKLGFRKDSRRFQAHLTIGRVHRGSGMADLAQLIQENAGLQFGKTTVREAVVFSSELTRKGPTYHPLGRATLGG